MVNKLILNSDILSLLTSNRALVSLNNWIQETGYKKIIENGLENFYYCFQKILVGKFGKSNISKNILLSGFASNSDLIIDTIKFIVSNLGINICVEDALQFYKNQIINCSSDKDGVSCLIRDSSSALSELFIDTRNPQKVIKIDNFAFIQSIFGNGIMIINDEFEYLYSYLRILKNSNIFFDYVEIIDQMESKIESIEKVYYNGKFSLIKIMFVDSKYCYVGVVSNGGELFILGDIYDSLSGLYSLSGKIVFDGIRVISGKQIKEVIEVKNGNLIL